MKLKQQTLKGFEFEIEDTKAFKTYYQKNAPLLQGHLLILKGEVSEEVKHFLDEKSAAYIDSNETDLQTRKKKSSAVLELPEVKAEVKPVDKASIKSLVYHKTIRSGEEINSDENLVFMERINSGARITSSACIQVFGIIDGLVKCDGDFLMLRSIAKGSVVFHGEELDKSLFSGELKLVEYINDAIVIKEIK